MKDQPTAYEVHSGENAGNHLAGDVRQAEVAALEAVDELRVIEAEEPEQRRVEVVDRDGVARDVVAEVVRLAVDDAGADAAPGQPQRVAPAVVVAAVVVLR